MASDNIPQNPRSKVDCPFVYANGRRCAGHIYRARAYGRHNRWGEVAQRDIRQI